MSYKQGARLIAPVAVAATAFSISFGVLARAAGMGTVGRYLPIGISVARGFVGHRLRRPVEAQLVVDESWAVSVGGGRFDRRVLIGAGALLYVCWVGGTALGVLGGSALGDPNRFGLDAAFPALFLALVAPRLRERRALYAALLGGALAAALIPAVPPGIPIVAASAACLLGWRRS